MQTLCFMWNNKPPLKVKTGNIKKLPLLVIGILTKNHDHITQQCYCWLVGDNMVSCYGTLGIKQTVLTVLTILLKQQ